MADGPAGGGPAGPYLTKQAPENLDLRRLQGIHARGTSGTLGKAALIPPRLGLHW